MGIQIEATGGIYNQDSLMATYFHGKIKVDIHDVGDENDAAEEFLESDDDLDHEEIEEEIDFSDEDIEIGSIEAYRFDLFYHPMDLAELGDAIDQDLSFMADFFLLNKKNYELISYHKYLFYISSVFIEPQYRGRGYALQGLAMFLELLAANGEVVSCHPSPMKDLKDKYGRKHQKGRKLMKRYWEKIGLDKYSKKHNILWTDGWDMPVWLRKSLKINPSWYF